MRTTSTRSRIILLVALLFSAGLAVMLFSFVTNAHDYVMKSVNAHLYTRGVLTGGGSILDRNGAVLSKNDNGSRTYAATSVLRKSLLHTVGDDLGFIASGVQKNFAGELVGYNLITGVNFSKNGKGNNLSLTVDAQVNAAAYNALNGRNGTVGVYNYKTGEIVCMVSAPSYDINDKPSDIGTDTTGKYDGIYVNKLLSGLLVPGSVFKTVTAVCAVDNIKDIMSRTFECTGEYKTPDGTVKCNDVHGKVSFEKAFNRSCNSAFAQIANELGKTRLEKTFEQLGLSTSYEIDRVSTAKGLFDLTKANKADLGWAGIGQYTTMLNPMSVMIMMGAIANDGIPVQPFFVDNAKSAAGVKVYRASSAKNLQRFINTTTASTLKTILRSCVTEYYGESGFEGMEICAKTGTAEIGGNNQPHAWFAGFSKKADFPYAFVVVVENGGKGLNAAAPVASKTLKALQK